jgi:hypothetical protein
MTFCRKSHLHSVKDDLKLNIFLQQLFFRCIGADVFWAAAFLGAAVSCLASALVMGRLLLSSNGITLLPLLVKEN